MSQSLSAASQPGFMIPVEVKAEHSSTKIIVLLVILAVLVGIGMFMYYRNHHRTRKLDFETIDSVPITVKNTTQLNQHLILPSGQRVTIEPDETAELKVSQGSTIRTETFLSSGELLKDVFRVVSTDPKKTLEYFFTNSGVRLPENISRNVRLINNSDIPVIFVERTIHNGRRWGSDIVPPHSEIVRDIFGNATTWEVVHPTDEDNPISKVLSGFRNTALIFDGEKLSSV